MNDSVLCCAWLCVILEKAAPGTYPTTLALPCVCLGWVGVSVGWLLGVRCERAGVGSEHKLVERLVLGSSPTRASSLLSEGG